MLPRLPSKPTAILSRAVCSDDVMRFFRALRILVLTSIVVFSGCTSETGPVHIFIVSDRYASITVIDRQKEYMLIAVMPVESLAAYRGTLMREDIQTDVFSSLSRLSGIEPDIIVSASTEQWRSLYSSLAQSPGESGTAAGAESVAERLNALRNGDAQSLFSAVNAFSVEGESAGEVEDLLRFMRESRYVLRVYQMETFFTGRGRSTLVERNTREWLKRAHQEIESRSIDR